VLTFDALTFNPFCTPQSISLRMSAITAHLLCINVKTCIMQMFFQIFLAAFLVIGCDIVAANGEDNARFDCYPERLNNKAAVNRTLCEARGCTWKQPASNDVSPDFCTVKIVCAKSCISRRTSIQ
jgi:hypothetical protein